jgi:hypothetical protein
MRIAAPIVVILVAATTAIGFGSQQAERVKPPVGAAPVVGCEDGGGVSSALTGAERRASVVAGPLTLVYARQQADQPAAGFDATRETLRQLIDDPSSREGERERARGTLAHTLPDGYGVDMMRIRISAGRQATLTVPAEHRASVSLVYAARARNRENLGAQGVYSVADGDPAVTFRACDGEDAEFLGGIVVAGARCVPLRIAEPGRPQQRRVVSFGAGPCVSSTDTGGADRLPAAARRVLRRPPYMGVACPTPNSIACDRVGLAVWLREPVRSVTASIAGRQLRLHPGGSGGTGAAYLEGYLQPAGLLGGPMRITPDRGRFFWRGEHPLYAAVALTVEGEDRVMRHVLLHQVLAAGWG